MKNSNFKESILNWLKEVFKKEAIKRMFGSAISGVKLFLAVTALNYIWKKYLGPAIRYLFRKIEIYFKRIKYNKKAERLENAKNENEFDSAADDLP